MIDELEHWKLGYHKIYDQYDFYMRKCKQLSEEIEKLKENMSLLTVDKMLLQNEIITLKRIIDESNLGLK